MIKSATAYRKGGEIILHADSKTTAGVWIASPPFTALSATVAVEELGMILLDTISKSAAGVPHPRSKTDWAAVRAPLFQAFNVKSIEAQMQGTVCCGIMDEDGILRIRPTRNEGAREGFVPVPGREICIASNASPPEIGAALIQGFTWCADSDFVIRRSRS